MTANAVPGFLPSSHGLRFVNWWPSGPARQWDLGMLHFGIGNPSRGLCGGMIFVARDRFERGEAPPADVTAPVAGTPLFREVVDRQFDSFGQLWSVPLRFWMASAVFDDTRRMRDSVREAWPRVRADIDAGTVSMLGLVRQAGWNPMAVGMGHQVAAFRYDATAARVAIGAYDPNHPGDDTIEIVMELGDGGAIRLSQSSGEPVLALLHLPYTPPRPPTPLPA